MVTAAIRVEFDGTVLSLAEEPGRLVATGSTAGVSSLPVLAHKSGMTPAVRVGGKQSSDEGMFNTPYGVAVDYQTGNICVSEFYNKRIQVFDSNGEYLFKFGDERSIPHHSISISKNRVFVCHAYSNHVLVHDLNRALITQLGGIGESQLFVAIGIAISEVNGDIYVCNSQIPGIKMFYKELPFKSQFAQGVLKSPKDIKLTDEFIYVLSYNEPLLYSFTYDFTQTLDSSSRTLHRWI